MRKLGWLTVLFIFVFVTLGSTIPPKANAVVDVALSCGVNQAAKTAFAASVEAAAAAAAAVSVLTVNLITAPVDAYNAAANTVEETKESCLDAIFFYIAQIVIRHMTVSMVNWINSGFQGSPSFISNPGQFFKDIVDQEAVGLLKELFPEASGLLNTLCSPINFQFDLRLKLMLKYGYRSKFTDKVGCTLSDIGENVSGAIDDIKGELQDFYDGNFRSGGWDRFFEITQNSENNQFALEYQIESELIRRAAQKVGIEKQVANWGDGFRSIEKTLGDGVTKVITAPGQFIQGQLQQVFGISKDQLAVADEINEIMAALLNQLLMMVLQKGFGGVSQSGSGLSGNDRSFLDDLKGDAQSNQYDQNQFNQQYQGTTGSSANSTTQGNTINPPTGTPTNNPSQNVAQQGVVRQSTYEDNTYAGTVIIDGQVGGSDYSYAATRREFRPWIQIDLKQKFEIDNVVIEPRPGSTHGGFYVYLSEYELPLTTGDNPVYQEGPGLRRFTINTQDSRKARITIDLKTSDVKARFVRIQRADGDTRESLELSEVSVYNKAGTAGTN